MSSSGCSKILFLPSMVSIRVHHFTLYSVGTLYLFMDLLSSTPLVLSSHFLCSYDIFLFLWLSPNSCYLHLYKFEILYNMTAFTSSCSPCALKNFSYTSNNLSLLALPLLISSQLKLLKVSIKSREPTSPFFSTDYSSSYPC